MFRTEKDSMGSMQVPVEAYYGAQTRRAELNFTISPLRLPRPMIYAMGLIKAAAAQVNLELGLLRATKAGSKEFSAQAIADALISAAKAVANGSHDDQFVVDIFQTGSGTSSNMNTNETIAGIANEDLGFGKGGKSPVHPNDHVNMGQSSNDVFPTAIHVAALTELHRTLIPALTTLHKKLAAKASEFDSIVKIGRTHLQDAVPIRLGQEFSGYASQIEHGIKRIRHAGEALAELPIGGTAVGTGINTHAEFSQRMCAKLTKETGVTFRPADNCFEAMANRDAAVEVSGTLKTVAISLSNIANNLRWLASGPRCGIGEIKIPELQPGSSIMPGKVNPVIPEAVMMIAAQVVGNDATIAFGNALGSNFELNVSMPVIAYNLLQSIELLSGAASHLVSRCLDATEHLGADYQGVKQVEADALVCADSIERSLAMCTALAPRLGYDTAAAIAKKAAKTNRNVREVALEIAGKTEAEAARLLGFSEESVVFAHGVPTAEEITLLLDPHAQTVPGTGAGGSAGG